MTFIPDYSLAPKAVFPAAHEDALYFVDWLLKSNYTDQDDARNIVQIGASVGGTMALYVAGKYSFPTVTWSAPVEFSNWIKDHQDVKASPDAKNDFGITDPEKSDKPFINILRSLTPVLTTKKSYKSLMHVPTPSPS